MGASDNLLAGFTGLAEGISNVLVPYVQMNQKATLEDRLAERKKQRDMIPISRVEGLSGRKTGLPANEFISPEEIPLVTKHIGDEDSFSRWQKQEAIRDYNRNTMETRREQERAEKEKREAEKNKYYVGDSTKNKYDSLRAQIRLGNQIREKLQNVIKQNQNITGPLTGRLNPLKEAVGMMPKENQAALTPLRLNFADFVRERGGTAFTPTEREVFSPIMPEEKVDEGTNLNRMEQMLAIMEDKRGELEQQYPGLTKTYSPAGIQDRPRTPYGEASGAQPQATAPLTAGKTPSGRRFKVIQ